MEVEGAPSHARRCDDPIHLGPRKPLTAELVDGGLVQPGPGLEALLITTTDRDDLHHARKLTHVNDIRQ
jgi:hypothetical protein